MKIKLFTLLALSLIAISLSASANAIPSPFYSSMINKMMIDPILSTNSFKTGYMQVNTNEHTVTLILDYPQFCGKSGICSQAIRAPLEIKLPITDTFRTQCGGITYHGEMDYRKTDGALQMIEITDNSLGLCPNDTGLSPTEGIYSTSNVMGKKSISRFFGSSLKEINAVP